jgi:hypothetical protein
MVNKYGSITVDTTTKQSTNNDSYNEIPYIWTYDKIWVLWASTKSR